MAHDKVFGICESKCMVETIAKSENPVKDVSYNDGLLTVLHVDGTTENYPINDVSNIVNFRWDGVASQLVLTNPDNTETRINLISFIHRYQGDTSNNVITTVTPGTGGNADLYKFSAMLSPATATKVNKIPDIETATNTLTTDVNELKSEVSDLTTEMERTAKVDGYYEEMSVGTADFILGRGDSVPAEFDARPTSGEGSIKDGIARIERIKGNSRSGYFNQLLGNPTIIENSEISCVSKGNGEYRISGTATSNNPILEFANVRLLKGHTYACVGLTNCILLYPYNGSSRALGGNGEYSYPTVTHDDYIGSITVAPMANILINTTIRPQIFDLTLIYGKKESYSTEQFRADFPNSYYPYQPAIEQNMTYSAIKSVGFNLFDEEYIMPTLGFSKQNDHWHINFNHSSEYQPEIWHNTVGYEGRVYYTSLTKKNSIYGHFSIYFYYTDGTMSSIPFNNNPDYVIHSGLSTEGKIIDKICMSFFMSAPLDIKNIQLNFSWSGFRDGETEKYWEDILHFPVNNYFPNGLRSITDTYYDEITKDKVINRINSITFDGTESWTFNNNADGITFMLSYNNLNRQDNTPYSCTHFQDTSGTDNTVGIGTGFSREPMIFIHYSACTTVEEFKAFLANEYAKGTPVILNYVRKVPIVETLTTPLDLTYRVSDFGTEEAMNPVGGNSTPLRMDVVYGLNATDTIRTLGRNYISKESFDSLAQTLSTNLNVDITATYDEQQGKYNFDVVDNRGNEEFDPYEYDKYVPLKTRHTMSAIQDIKTVVNGMVQRYTGTLDLTYIKNKDTELISLNNAYSSSYRFKRLIINDLTSSGGDFGDFLSGQTYVEEVYMYRVTPVNVNNFFNGCTSLKRVVWLYDTVTSQLVNLNTMFIGCTSLTDLVIPENFYNTPNFGEGIHLKLSDCPLSHASAINVLNSLANRQGSMYKKTVTFKTSTYNTLTPEEIAIATDKNWNVTYSN